MPGPLESLFKLKLPKPPEVSPEQEQLYRANVEREQATQSPLRKAAQRVLTAPAEILSGLFHDPTQDLTAEQRNPAYAIGALGAALPFAPKGVKGMYSRVEKIAESLPESIHPNKLATILRNRASQEEVQWRGLDKLMQGAGGRQIPKQTVVEQLETNPLDVKVITKGEHKVPGAGYDDSNYADYTMPGASNYRETLIQLDKPTTPDDHIPQVRRTDLPQNAFHSHHWDEPNVLVHVRHNERRLPGDAFSHNYISEFGPKGRMLENVQSDWHQRGAHSGYAGSTVLGQVDLELYGHIDRLKDQLEERLTHYNQLFPDLGMSGDTSEDARRLSQRLWNEVSGGRGEFEAPFREIQDLMVQLDNATDATVRQAGEAVPDAPFKDSWAELALKQQLLDVADRPEIEWLGIAPSSELRARGEVISPEFQDKQLPNTLEKLLKPFGGTIEKADLGIKPSHVGDPTTIYPEMPSHANTALGPFGGLVQRTPDDVEELLSFIEPPTNISEVMALKDQIVAQRPNIQAFIARLTPEMKQVIKEKGFPLLSLVALMRLMEQDSSPEAANQAMAGLEAQ